jgi:hypothetical protein
MAQMFRPPHQGWYHLQIIPDFAFENPLPLQP